MKDPASIPWLKTKVHDPRFFSHWLEEWQNTFEGYGTWEWLEGRERWIELFVSRFTHEANETRRVQLLEVLAGFDDASVVSVFERLSRTTIVHREALIVAAYARVHGMSVDPQRITRAVEVLAHDSANHQLLAEMAYQLRDAAFVPFLISIVDRRPEMYSREEQRNPQDALQKITFETRVVQKPEWQRWFASHGDAGREAWLRRAQDAFRRLLQEDEDGAAAFFEKAVHNWDDIAWLSFVERDLVHRPRFRNDVAGWINLTYQPAYRARLAALARKVAPHAASLEPWSRELLVDRSFLPGRRRGTWTEYVRMANSAI